MKKILYALFLGVMVLGVGACKSDKGGDDEDPKVVGTFTFAPEFPEGITYPADSIAMMGVRIMPQVEATWVVTGTFGEFQQPMKAVPGIYSIELISEPISTDEIQGISTVYYGSATFTIIPYTEVAVPVKMATATVVN